MLLEGRSGDLHFWQKLCTLVTLWPLEPCESKVHLGPEMPSLRPKGGGGGACLRFQAAARPPPLGLKMYLVVVVVS